LSIPPCLPPAHTHDDDLFGLLYKRGLNLTARVARRSTEVPGVASMPLHASPINPESLLPLVACSGRLLLGYGDAARHVGRAMVGGRPLPVEGDPERVARVQRPRFEQSVVRGNVVRVFALS
jgi:hypothetical protein